MTDVLHKFYDKVEDELDTLSKKDTLSPTELENGKNAVCTLEKILKIDSMMNGMDNESSYGYYPSMSYGTRRSTNGMNMSSRGRSRDSMGRYTSNSGRMPMNRMPYYMDNSYGNMDHKNRLIAKIETMMQNAENDFEVKELEEFKNHVENDYV